MNAKRLIATVAVLVASSSALASADRQYPHPANGFVSTKSRAEVVAEVKKAYVDGSLVTNDAFPPPVATTGTARSRADVLSDGVKRVKNNSVDIDDTYFGS